jgi:thimet oligopeptidase
MSRLRISAPFLAIFLLSSAFSLGAEQPAAEAAKGASADETSSAIQFIPQAPVDASAGAAAHLWSGGVDADTITAKINQRLSRAQAAIDRLLAVKGKRTLKNTLAPFDEATDELDSASYEAQLVQATHPQAAVRDAAQAMVQKVSAAQTALSLNQPVYRALAALDVSRADPATRYYVQRQLLEFRLSGVDRSDATRSQIRALNDELTALGSRFQRNLADDVPKITARPSELDGLPADFIARHAPAADGTITLSTEPPDVFPVMKFSSDAGLRRRMYLAYTSRAYPKNEEVLAELLDKRSELAALLKFANWADLNAADKMVQNARAISEFIDQLDAASKATAGREYQMMLTQARQQNPGLQVISASDASYWQERVRRANFDFDSQSARPYFPYDRVQQGILDIASRLFKVSIRPVRDAVAWDPSVTTWDVFDGKRRLGRFFLDMHPRAGKDKWFSMYPVRDGKRGRHLPEAALICNFPGGKPGDPGLMEYGDVVTFFHEFGHLVHWIFEGQQRWAGTAGMMENDFVEAPSQMLEEWMHDPKVLATFARHYQTNQPIPEEMVRRMNRADAFGHGLWMRRQLSYTALSLLLHEKPVTRDDLERTYYATWKRYVPFEPIEGDHMVASFRHLVGYSSGYYTYLWDKVIAEDFFRQFNANDLLAGDTPLRYRKTVLEKTGTMPANEIVKNFLGRPQSVDALVRWMNQEFEAENSPASPPGE